jgi:RHS repeat-associated protein
LYSVHALTDETGSISEVYQYTAYGMPTVWKDAGADSTWFTNDDVLSTTVTTGSNAGTGAPVSNVNNSRLYTGQYWVPLDVLDATDPDNPVSELGTGVQYSKNRWYQPELGRWLSRDPIGYSAGISLYGYGISSPVKFLDTFGLVRKTVGQLIPLSCDDPCVDVIRGKSVWQTGAEKSGKLVCGFKDIEVCYCRVKPINLAIAVHSERRPLDELDDELEELEENYQYYESQSYSFSARPGAQARLPAPSISHFLQNSWDERSGRFYKCGKCKCVVELYITGHGDDVEYFGKHKIGNLEFCKPCTILLVGCSTADVAAQRIADRTGCNVRGSSGDTYAGEVRLGMLDQSYRPRNPVP